MSTGELIANAGTDFSKMTLKEVRKLLPAVLTLEALPEAMKVWLSENALMAACDPDNRAIAVREANGETLTLGQLTRAKVPAGGGTRWEIEELGNIRAEEFISGAMVIYRKRAILWPTEEDAIEGTTPILFSDDLVKAYYNPAFLDLPSDERDWGNIDQDIIEAARIEGTPFFDMQTLHYNQWKSSAKGEGKRMKEGRVVGILPQGSVYPIMVNIGPGSLNEVVATMAKAPNFHYATLVSLGLVADKNARGIKYSRVVIRVDGELPDIEAALLKAMYTDPLHAAIAETGRQAASAA